MGLFFSVRLGETVELWGEIVMKYYDQKVCVVTGAASGIGRACALALGSFGAKTIITDIRKEMLDETADLIKAAGGHAETHLVDVANRDAVYDLAGHVEKNYGAADFVLNNAGVAMGAPVYELGIDDFNWLMDIDFWGVVYGTQAFLPQMRARNSGNIANVSSVFGLFSFPEQSAYNAAKFAVLGFTDAARHDLADTNIGVTTIHPGGINTNIVRHARVGQDPEAETRRQDDVRKIYHDAARKSRANYFERRRQRQSAYSCGPRCRVYGYYSSTIPKQLHAVYACSQSRGALSYT